MLSWDSQRRGIDSLRLFLLFLELKSRNVVVADLHLKLLWDVSWKNLLLVATIDEIKVSAIQESVWQRTWSLLIAEALFSTVRDLLCEVVVVGF